jgi:Domain of unknown function (DUF4191)
MARKERKSSGRMKQVLATYRMTRQVDPKIGWLMAAVGLGVFAVALGLGFLLDHPVYAGFMGLMFGLLATLVFFGRRAERAAYAQVEGQVGAAMAVLNALRKGWTVTPAVAITKNQDAVHRAVGRPGVVLIGEGAPSRVPNLLAAEKRRTARFVGDAPVYDVIVGDADGQVPLRKLNRHLQKLPRNLKPGQVTELNPRLRALTTTPNVPIPKGPLPKNVRLPRGNIR